MKSFEFNYRGGEDEKLYLEGKHDNFSEGMLKYYESRQASERLQTILVSVLLPHKKNYQEDIRSYRLFQGDLYNIDLEDK